MSAHHNQGRGTNQLPFRVLTPYKSGSTTLRGAGPNTATPMGVGDYAHFTTSPANDDQSSANHRIFQGLDNTDLVSLSFYMVMSDGTDPNNKTGTAYFALARQGTEYPKVRDMIGHHAVTLALTCGDKALVSSPILPPTAKWCDNIVVSLDGTEAPGATVNSAVATNASFADGIARVRFGKEGAQWLIGQLIGDNGTPSSRVGAVLWGI